MVSCGSACHSNLSDEKLPGYLKANKMNFLMKPECLNFTGKSVYKPKWPIRPELIPVSVALSD